MKQNDKFSETPKSYYSPKVRIRKSKTHGDGIYAVDDISEGEIVFIKGGHIVTREEMFSSSVINSYLPISDDYFLAAISKEEEDDIKLWINHSCEPNCGMRGEISFVAMKDIKKGEELTIDYAMIDNEDYRFECTCGTKSCRKKITGFDWKLKSLQDKYGQYFARYLRDKFKR